ncbi:unnamed protein product (macronuclear) [Paramecium tetraurelia]|uniref:Transmembrane protein n=1 Tax=Paramecium tetraurelia TaxID=5888 RepID=A0DFU2_PARTE|nr:uncharacterized protein GSPATT00016722001 [Paramecium tetraurelia]CAK81909.1 unnamed protein product [Paramecium tetraurelia]|eukprot:XP_001449306.1 hypothetical protein (macronuclear) [Paramecium tetraurelia strain d4-2]
MTHNYLLLNQIFKSCFLQIIPYISMNCLNYFDQSLILQQQLILQQMLIYNQMLKASFSQAIPNTNISIQKQEELELSNSQLPKQDDTNPIQPKEQKKKIKSQKKFEKKGMQQPKTENNCSSQPHELPKKKKVFLSMLDIKAAQYKKFKSQNNEDEQIPPTSVNVQV